jgi:hypothetical protein
LPFTVGERELWLSVASVEVGGGIVYAFRDLTTELRRQLAYKSEWYGSRLVIADRFFPSSKLCSGCGTIKDMLGLNERVYACDVCGLSLDRDENAAINLRRLAAEQLPVDRREDTPVERKTLALASASAKPASLKQEATANDDRRSTRRSTRKQVLVRV